MWSHHDQEDVGQEDGRKGGGVGEGETPDSDVPSGRISPSSLLSYKWGHHLCWPQRQGKRERVFFLNLQSCLPSVLRKKGLGWKRARHPNGEATRRAVKKLAGAPIILGGMVHDKRFHLN